MLHRAMKTAKRIGAPARWITAGVTRKNPLQFYMNVLEKYPLTTKVITSGVIGAVGDWVCQTQVESRWISSSGEENEDKAAEGSGAPFDYGRFARFTFLNMALVPPALHFAYGFLQNSIKVAGMRGVLLRVACDQLIFAPTIIFAMISSLKLLETGDATFAVSSTLQRFPDTMLANYSVWPLAQLISFTFIPLQFRVLWANVIGVFWSVYLSWTATVPTDKDRQEEE